MIEVSILRYVMYSIGSAVSSIVITLCGDGWHLKLIGYCMSIIVQEKKYHILEN